MGGLDGQLLCPEGKDCPISTPWQPSPSDKCTWEINARAPKTESLYKHKIYIYATWLFCLSQSICYISPVIL